MWACGSGPRGTKDNLVAGVENADLCFIGRYSGTQAGTRDEGMGINAFWANMRDIE